MAEDYATGSLMAEMEWMAAYPCIHGAGGHAFCTEPKLFNCADTLPLRRTS
jgi:hypothetical protein